MRTRLTERDLSRIVKRVINEEGGVVKPDTCELKLKKLRNEYKKVIDKMNEYLSLEWWEWYDKYTLSPTVSEIKLYAQYLEKEIKIRKECNNSKK